MTGAVGALAALALAAASPGAPAPPAAGDGGAAPLRPWTRGDTPPLAGADLAGRPVSLEALRGRVVLVAFWASWCEPCEAELEELARLRAALAARPFALVTVNFGEGPARVEQFLAAHRLELPVVLDRDQRVAKAWGVGGVPMAFLVDAGGQVRASAFGERDWRAGEPGAALERLLGEAERAARAPRGERRAEAGRPPARSQP
ncbi:TlpA family protein disulfide reductase [Anaeromyxobacter paludicola]|uniref:Thioredoxin domain-containing protein n=1 Tax=Anaeromyxobacter paludicola TaxID=2918171 RepID=A0ABN6NAE8_9BACT|nr:TlpA disulfide reductase family protein [Anaeromyxobacter paludicola]BDG10011.1 hypothetical protein AMPC_31240 [Anaeromyxobacter paludicola]